MSWYSSVANVLAENSLLQRLCFATVELVVLSLILALVLRWARFSSQRLVACLWLIVLAKPLLTLAVGAPIVLFEFQVRSPELSQEALALHATAPGTALRAAASLTSGSAPESAAVGSLPEVASSSDTLTQQHASRTFGVGSLRAGTLLLVAWATGVAWCAARYARTRRRLARMVRDAAHAPAPARQTYAAITRELGLERVPALRVIDDLDSPALVGLVQPTVLLPRRLVEHESTASTQWALRHELAHWRWRDPLAILLRDFTSVVFFFHPLLPWIVRRHAEAMEMACDWESLRDPSEAAEYAEGLCGILLLMRNAEPKQVVGSSLAMATHGRMMRRIRALLEGERARPLSSRGAACVALVAVAVFTLGCGITQDANASAEPQVPATTPDAHAGSGKEPSKAILDGLRWLARHQNEDGSWSPTTIAKLCPCEEPIYKPANAYTKRFDEGLTGLALLSFLGVGFTDQSPQEMVDTTTGKRYRLGDIVGKGLRWLAKKQNPDGSFCVGKPYMYSEAMATMALAEAYGLTQSNEWKEPAQRGLDFIQAAQRPSPSGKGLWGWRYASRQEIDQFARGGATDATTKAELYLADSSVTGWCTMALASGRMAGLEIKDENFRGALAFTKFATADNGLVGYIDPKGAGATVTGPGDHYVYHPTVMSALGICTRIFSDHKPDDPFLDLAAKQVMKDLPVITQDKLSIDYYYWYFGSLALSQVDGPHAPQQTGKYWSVWSKAAVDALVALQDQTGKACTNGGWMVPDRWCRDGGPIYTTALNVLTLEVYDRTSGVGASPK